MSQFPPASDPNSGEIPLKPIAPPGPEVEAGKLMALLSYVFNFLAFPFFLIPLLMKDNPFSLYHARQSMMVWLLSIAVYVVCGALAMTVVLACVAVPLGGVVWVLTVVMNIMGIVNASKGQYAPLPVIGKLGEKWFGGPPPAP